MKFKGRYWFLVGSVLFLGLVFYFFTNIITYVLIAFVLSMIGQPVMTFLLEKLNFSRIRIGAPLAAVIVIFLFMAFFALLAYAFVPLVIKQANNLAGVNYKQISVALEEPIGQMTAYLEEMGISGDGESPEQLVKEALKDWYNPARISDFFGSLVGLASEVILGVFSVAFILFFFLQERGMLINFVLALVPRSYEDGVKHALEDIIRLLRRYFGGIFIQITTITIFVSVSLTLLGVKNAILIGVFAALINVIPYLGPLIGATFGVFITVSSNLDLDFYNEMFPLLIKVVSVFVAVQLIDNFILQPYIFSNSVLAHPLEIFIVILIAAQLGGIVGMILAIPVYTLIRVVARTFLSEFKIVQKLTDSIEKSEQ